MLHSERLDPSVFVVTPVWSFFFFFFFFFFDISVLRSVAPQAKRL